MTDEELLTRVAVALEDCGQDLRSAFVEFRQLYAGLNDRVESLGGLYSKCAADRDAAQQESESLRNDVQVSRAALHWIREKARTHVDGGDEHTDWRFGMHQIQHAAFHVETGQPICETDMLPDWMGKREAVPEPQK